MPTDDMWAHPAGRLLAEGLASKHEGLLARALELYETALARASEEPANALLQTAANVNIGNLYRLLGNRDTSWAYYARAGTLASNHGLHEMSGHVANCLAGLAWEAEDFDSALDGYQEARDIFAALDNAAGVASAEHNIASVYEALQEYEIALPIYRRAADSAHAAGARDLETQALCQVGGCLLGQGLALEAIEPLSAAFEMAVQIGHLEKIGSAAHNLGVARIRTGDLSEGLLLLEAAVFTRLQLSLASPTVRQRASSLEPSLRSLAMLVRHLAVDGQLDRIAVVAEVVRRQGTVVRPATGADLPSQARHVTAIIEERRQLRKMLDVLESGGSTTGGCAGAGLAGVPTPSVADAYQDSLIRLAKLESTLGKEMAAHGRINVDPGRPRPSNGEAIVEFLPIAQDPGVVVLRTHAGTTEIGHVVGAADTLPRWQETYHDAIESLASGEAAAGRQLLVDVVSDMSRRLPAGMLTGRAGAPAVTTVVLLPWATVDIPPLEALLVDGVPLGLHWPVVRALSRSGPDLSGDSLADGPSVSPPTNPRALIVADPTRSILGPDGSSDEHALPAADREGAYVSKALAAQGWDVTRVAPEACTRAGIRDLLVSGDYGLFHFAGHIRHDPYPPERGGLVLRNDAGTAVEVLTAEELLYSIRLRAEPLVVLNGCGSGTSGLGSGNDLGGLLQALLVAGASDVIVTGWPVTDAGAEAFMTAFYASLGGGAPASAGLLHARRAVFTGGPAAASSPQDSLGNVEDWAAFRLYTTKG